MPDKKEGRKLRIKKNNLYTIIIVIGALVLAGVLIYFKSYAPNSSNEVSVSLAKCIGQNSHVYVQLGCSHCADQEALFGNTWQYMTSTDCYYNPSACVAENITGTPTWIINGKYYLGTQSIETLKSLTGC